MVDITPILVAVIALLGAIITVFVIPWVRTKLTKDQQELVMTVANAVVLAVEQVYTALDGPTKKETAMIKVKEWLAKCNIKVDDKIIDEAIESCVKQMNIQIKGS